MCFSPFPNIGVGRNFIAMFHLDVSIFLYVLKVEFGPYILNISVMFVLMNTSLVYSTENDLSKNVMQVDTVRPSLFLQVAFATNNSQHLAAVLRFLSDLTPGFKETSDYSRYHHILTEMNSCASAWDCRELVVVPIEQQIRTTFRNLLAFHKMETFDVVINILR